MSIFCFTLLCRNFSYVLLVLREKLKTVVYKVYFNYAGKVNSTDSLPARKLEKCGKNQQNSCERKIP